jgi:hypothetical protein
MLKVHDMRLHASSSALLALALTLGSSFATTTEDRLNDAVTAWQWRYGQTAAQISTTINQGYRAVDIEVESSSPLRFSAAFVRNTGSYNDATWWYHGLSVSELSSKCSQLGGAHQRSGDLPRERGAQVRGAPLAQHRRGEARLGLAHPDPERQRARQLRAEQQPEAD